MILECLTVWAVSNTGRKIEFAQNLHGANLLEI